MIETKAMESDLLFARRLPKGDGYTYTLASRLGDILAKAEEMFGPRDAEYSILGVELHGTKPQVWYPGNRKHVIVQLAESCITDMPRACFQMAHESVHLLSPTGGSNATYFEEGLAEYYSRHYMRSSFGNPNWRSDVESYLIACKMIEPHLNKRPDAVKTMRESQPAISQITGEQLAQHFPELKQSEVDFLVQHFDRGIVRNG